MYPVSAEFLTTLRSPNMQVVVSVITSSGVQLAVADGSVSMDASREIGRTATLELMPTGAMSTHDVFALVSQPGVEIIIRRGLRVSAGLGEPKTDELIPLGVFTTDNASISKTVDATVSWSGSDRSKKVTRNRFVEPYQITSGTPLATAGRDLLQSRLIDAPCEFGNVSDTIGATVAFEAGADSNPWKSARDLFANHGYELRFNGDGVATAVEIPDPATNEAVFDFGDGDTSLLLDGEEQVTLDNVYNGVIASGEGTDVAAPVRAVVWDTDSSSPTYYLGGYGQVPYFFSSPLITSEEQATKAARTLLSKVKGRTQQLRWPAIVNPALEPLDLVSVTFNGKTQLAVIDSLTIPLGASGTMSAKARQTKIS